MRAQSRAAGESDRAARGSSRDTLSGACSIADLDLPEHLLERLHAHDIRTWADWRALGRRRYQLWGVTRRMVAEIDAAAGEARP